MAQKTVVELIDDLDGTPAEETVEFGLDGVDYEIDLSEDNAERIRDALAGFVEHARRTGKRGKRAGITRSVHRVAAERSKNQQVREWARSEGHSLADRGRLPNEIIAAYDEAHRAA